MRKAPDFWWKPGPDPRALALWPVSVLWGLGATWRMARRPAATAPMPVLCVGNLTVGGAGKTPVAIAIARLAAARGIRPGFLARGYGGSEKGPLRVDPALHTAREVGDEALLLAAVAPTAIGADRGASVGLLASAGVELAILDDGFQSPSLAKDASVLVVDGGAGVGNGRVLPAGPLRAPVGPQLKRAAAVVIVGPGEAGAAVAERARKAGKPVIKARLRTVGGAFFVGKRVLAFAGIGRPEKFFASLRASVADVVNAVAYPDHQDFSPADADYLLKRAEAEGLLLVTTAKDRVRMRGAEGLVARLAERVAVLQVEAEFEERGRLAQMIDGLAAKRRG